MTSQENEKSIELPGLAIASPDEAGFFDQVQVWNFDQPDAFAVTRDCRRLDKRNAHPFLHHMNSFRIGGDFLNGLRLVAGSPQGFMEMFEERRMESSGTADQSRVS